MRDERPPPILHTERLILRMAEPGDLAALLRFYVDNQRFLEPWSPANEQGFLTERFQARRIDRNWEDYRCDRAVRFFLFPREQSDRIIGLCSFANIVRGVAQYCNVGYALAEDAQGKGLITEALRTAIPWAFAELNLHRMMAGYMPRNERSAAVLRRLGFAVEGYARDYLYINGRWEDHIITGLINPNWRPADSK